MKANGGGEDIFNVGSEFSGVVVYRRKVFEDPILTVYYLKGEPIYAESFVMKRRWWEGLLSEEEVERHIFGDMFRYAYETYGERYVSHLKRYAKDTVSLTEDMVRDFGWELEAEATEDPPEDMAAMFHVPYEAGSTSEERALEIASKLNAFGFPVFYVSGSGDDPHGFFHAVRTNREVMDKVAGIFEEIGGSIAFVLPLYIIARLDLDGGRAWVVTKDARKLALALRYLRSAEDVPDRVLNEVIDTLCCRYVVWRGEKGTFYVFDGAKTLSLGSEETVETVERYLRTYDRILNAALSSLPSGIPSKMGRMLLYEITTRHPDTEGFVGEFSRRFGVKLDYE